MIDAADDLTERVAGGRRMSGGFNSSSGEPEKPGAQESLFRSQALNESDRGFGQPIAYLPRTWQLMSGLLVALLVACILMLFVTSYERKETVRGILRADRGEAQIVAPERGLIREVRVADGAMVHAGDVLVIVSTDRPGLGGADPQGDMLRSLAVQEQSLRRRLDAISGSDGLEVSVASAQVDELLAGIHSGEADLAASRQQFAIADDEYKRAVPIAERGFISRSEILRRQQAVVVARQAVADTSGQIARLKAQLAQQRSTAAKRPYTTTRDLGAIEDLLADLRQRRAQYAMGRGFAIRAPVDGRVTTVQASAGEVVDPLKPIMTVVPAHSRMIAVLYVASRGVGFLRPGNRVRLRYDAFPFETFGAAQGTIRSVSETVLRPEEVEAAVRLEEPSYRVVAALDGQTMTAFGQAHPLLPGMALTADIVLEKRSFAAWLFQPILAMRGHL